MSFQLEQLHQTHDWISPFDVGEDGYDEDGWWTDDFERVLESPREHFYRLLLQGREVARARVEVRSHIYDGYGGDHAGEDWPHVAFLEVHSAHRRLGIGQTFVRMIRSLYGPVLWTQTDDAAEFWRALGWTEYLPAGGEEGWWRVFVDST